MTLFFALAAACVIAVLLLLLPTLIKRRKASSSTSAVAVNADIIKDQLAELERDQANGTLSTDDLPQARIELQKRLLEDASAVTVPSRKLMARRSAWIIGIIVPLGALLLYFALGNLPALTPVSVAETAAPKVSAQQVENMVGQLAAKLERNPEDTQGWVTLARSYKMLGRYAEANKAYERAGNFVANDPQLLADYAESLAFAADRSLKGKPTQLIERALQLNPDHPQALVLAGTAAYEREDYAAAVQYWERLQQQLAPDSDDAKMLANSIKKAKTKMK